METQKIVYPQKLIDAQPRNDYEFLERMGVPLKLRKVLTTSRYAIHNTYGQTFRKIRLKPMDDGRMKVYPNFREISKGGYTTSGSVNNQLTRVFNAMRITPEATGNDAKQGGAIGYHYILNHVDAHNFAVLLGLLRVKRQNYDANTKKIGSLPNFPAIYEETKKQCVSIPSADDIAQIPTIYLPSVYVFSEITAIERMCIACAPYYPTREMIDYLFDFLDKTSHSLKNYIPKTEKTAVTYRALKSDNGYMLVSDIGMIHNEYKTKSEMRRDIEKHRMRVTNLNLFNP